MKAMARSGSRLAAISATVLVLVMGLSGMESGQLSPEELARARNLTRLALPPMPADPTNRFADDGKAAELGRRLFFDTKLSANGQIACATCHLPDNGFQDGIPRGTGLATGIRRTMPIAGTQWGNWFFWDGRKDSMWSQALEPLENPIEHGMTRAGIARLVLDNYSGEYEALFGPRPDHRDWPLVASPLLPGEPQANWAAAPQAMRDAIDDVYANIGKAIAAYERTLIPEENRFDRFVGALVEGREPQGAGRLSEDEIAGFRLFTGKARCDNCHSGPRMTDDFFHNTGVPLPEDLGGVDYGRALVLEQILADPFNCLGPHSDAQPESCRELRFMSRDQKLFEGSFKTPTLRGVAWRPPYMHAGQFDTLQQVVDHYVAAPDPFSGIPDVNGEIIDHGRHAANVPLDLTEREKAQLIAFLETL